MKSFYIYVYMNPLHLGPFIYKDVPYTFPFLPFYIGMGTGNRYLHHLYVSRGSRKKALHENEHKINTIKALLKKGQSPIIHFLAQNLTKEEAEAEEERYILAIGRNIDGGPLTNIATGDPFKGKLILKGANHPGFGKTRDQKTIDKIKLNHQDVRGKNNPRAKKWRIIDPQKKIYIIEGSLKSFCEEHKLALGVLKRIRGKGPYKLERSHTKGYAKNTEGWSIEELC